MNLFQAHHISKMFVDEGNRETILRNISFDVQDGELLGLMGPSGCGKSTLLRILAGLIPASEGKVLNRPSKIGFVFQNFGLLPWLNVEDNIGFGLKMAGMTKPRIAKIVDTEIERLRLNGLEQSYPKELSGGQKQRVGFARALAIDPDVLLLDEAFSALDTFTAEELRADLLKIWQDTGKTIVMVTHLPSEAVQLADRVLVFSTQPGEIREEVKIGLGRPRKERSQEFYTLEDKLEALINPDSH